jgi:hypothetical protein
MAAVRDVCLGEQQVLERVHVAELSTGVEEFVLHVKYAIARSGRRLSTNTHNCTLTQWVPKHLLSPLLLLLPSLLPCR